MPKKLNDITGQTSSTINLSRPKSNTFNPKSIDLNSPISTEINHKNTKPTLSDIPKFNPTQPFFLPAKLPFHQSLTPKLKLIFITIFAIFFSFSFVTYTSHSNFQEGLAALNSSYQSAEQSFYNSLSLFNTNSYSLAKLNFQDTKSQTSQILANLDKFFKTESLVQANFLLPHQYTQFGQKSQELSILTEFYLAKLNLIDFTLQYLDQFQNHNFATTYTFPLQQNFNPNTNFPSIYQNYLQNLKALSQLTSSENPDFKLLAEQSIKLNELIQPILTQLQALSITPKSTLIIAFNNDLYFQENLPRLQQLFSVEFSGLTPIKIQPISLPESSKSQHRFVLPINFQSETNELLNSIKSISSSNHQLLQINYSQFAKLLSPEDSKILPINQYLSSQPEFFYTQINKLFATNPTQRKQLLQTLLQITKDSPLQLISIEQTAPLPANFQGFYVYNSNLNSPQILNLTAQNTLTQLSPIQSQITLNLQSTPTPKFQNYQYFRQFTRLLFNESPTETKLSLYLPLSAKEFQIEGISPSNYSINTGPHYKVLKFRLNSTPSNLKITYTTDATTTPIITQHAGDLTIKFN